MGLPLPVSVPDVGPGGPLMTTFNALASLQNNQAQARYNQVKAQYAPLSLSSKALSELAYSQLVGPQFLAKIMGNDSALANMTEDQKRQALNTIYRAGTGQGAGLNAINNMPTTSGPSSLLDTLVNGLQNVFSGNKPASATSPPANALIDNQQYNVPSQPQNPSSYTAPESGSSFNPSQQKPIDVNEVIGNEKGSEIAKATTAWLSSPEASEQAQKDGYYSLPPEEQRLQWYRGKQQSQQGKDSNTGYSYDANGNNTVASPQEVTAAVNRGQPGNSTYADNVARYKGIIKEGEQLGTDRGKAISDLGKQQLDLSNSGVILDRLIGITQRPEFQEMRSRIPYFQDKQLWYLSKNGNRAEQDMIGDLISTAEAYKASTVNSFKGKALEKEFDLANKIKIDENDTFGVVQGKLRSLKTLKEIAESKNDIILGLMTNKHMNQGEAVKQANKMVDTSSIEKQVDDLLNPKPTESDIQYMMKKRNLPREEIVKQLKAKGYKNVS